MTATPAGLTLSRLAVILLPLAAIASGCATLPSGKSAEDVDAAAALAGGAGASPEVAATLDMEIRAAGKDPEFRKLPLQGALHVQDALEQAELTRRFRRMNLYVMRPTEGRLAKLDIEYKHTARRVDPLYDYALRPGDHLVVTEDTSTALDDLMSGISSPFTGGRKK